MSKTATQDKVQQDLYKYWNNSQNTRIPAISINSENFDSRNNTGKKRKAPSKEMINEEKISPPQKRMHETMDSREELHRSLSSSNLQPT